MRKEDEKIIIEVEMVHRIIIWVILFAGTVRNIVIQKDKVREEKSKDSIVNVATSSSVSKNPVTISLNEYAHY